MKSEKHSRVLIAIVIAALLILGVLVLGMMGKFPAAGAEKYTELYYVHEGDTPSSIAGELCDDASSWNEIYELNAGVLDGPDTIEENDCLLIPVSDDNSFTKTNESITENWTENDWDCLGKMTIYERKTYLSYLKKEPEVSAMMKGVVEEVGGYLEGFENRCKTPHSLYEKMYLRPVKRSIDEIGDILRYTEIIPEDTYSVCVENTLDVFGDEGWVTYSFWNAWIDDSVAYKGINVQLKNDDNMLVEIQFHTEKSFEVKNSEEDHSLYEQRRLLEVGSDEYNEILEKQFKLYSVVEVPKGVETLTEESWTQIQPAA